MMRWVEESDDPRVAKIAGVLDGKSGLDSSDVWSLTNKIIDALDAPEEDPALPEKPTKLDGKRWWISWYSETDAGGWGLWFPWWISGWDARDRDVLVAAVIADSEDEAKELIYQAYDERPSDIEWRFCNELAEGESPFSDRFRKADWHVWPE